MAIEVITDAKLAEHFKGLMHRYGASPDAFAAVLRPLLVPILSLDRTIRKEAGQSHYRASFTLEVTPDCRGIIQRGRTGKFVPAAHKIGDVWREIAKGRIISVDRKTNIATGEVYVGSSRADLATALGHLDEQSLLEIDQFGAAAKVLSGLEEYYLANIVAASGYNVLRMPEDMAKHLGYYANYDFEFEKGEVTKKVELKSIWGTDTRFARLIHSKSAKAPKGKPSTWTKAQTQNYYPTSSCKFATQDIFAVSMFLRTGNIAEFAFARSVPKTKRKPYGLPPNANYPEHVSQNPRLDIGDGTWFATIDEVWNLR